tara:strand:+ start:2890 stop:4149 length:1260 start_codon:yes stop_codon:yes gene_type:complete
MYTKIINPKTNRKVNINSKLGSYILKNYLVYLNHQYGSSSSSDNSEVNNIGIYWKDPYSAPLPYNRRVLKKDTARINEQGITSGCYLATQILVLKITIDNVMKQLTEGREMSSSQLKIINDYKLRWGELFFSLFFEYLHRSNTTDINFQALYNPSLKKKDIDFKSFNKITKWEKIEWVLEDLMEVNSATREQIKVLISTIYKGFTGQQPDILTRQIDNENIDDIIKQSDKEPIVLYIKNGNEPDHWFYMYKKHIYTTYGMAAYIDEERGIKMEKADIEDPTNEGSILSPLQIFNMEDTQNVELFSNLLRLLKKPIDTAKDDKEEFIKLYKYFFLGTILEKSNATGSSKLITQDRVQKRIHREAELSYEQRNRIEIVALFSHGEYMSSHIFDIINLIISYHFNKIHDPKTSLYIKQLAGK